MKSKKVPILFTDNEGRSSNCQIRMGDKPVPIRIAYIGGGSRGWAQMLMMDLALCSYFCGEVLLYDIDHKASEFNARFGNWMQSHEGAKSRWKYRSVTTIKEALKHSDFVFISIQPGPIEQMKHDLHMPERCGVYQTTGDTVGPGGTIRGFRSVRIYQHFAKAIAEHSPNAWVLNFTNPMSVCTRTLYATFPGIKAYGCCHEVFSTQRTLGHLYAHYKNKPVPNRQEVEVNVLGINHFTWVNKAQCHGVDLLDLVRKYIQKPNGIRLFPAWEKYSSARLKKAQNQLRLTWELMKRFDTLPAAGVRHVAEFLPWFITSADSWKKWGFHMIPYSYRIDRWNKAPAQARKILNGRQQLVVRPSSEEFLNQMAALKGLTEFTTNVNLPNQGQILDVPPNAMVETNAVFSQNSVRPLAAGRLPATINAWVNLHIANQEAIVEATMTRNKDLGFQAFINDPLMGRVNLDDAWKLYQDMLKATDFKF